MKNYVVEFLFQQLSDYVTSSRPTMCLFCQGKEALVPVESMLRISSIINDWGNKEEAKVRGATRKTKQFI